MCNYFFWCWFNVGPLSPTSTSGDISCLLCITLVQCNGMNNIETYTDGWKYNKINNSIFASVSSKWSAVIFNITACDLERTGFAVGKMQYHCPKITITFLVCHFGLITMYVYLQICGGGCTQQTNKKNIFITFVQRRPNVFNVGSTL